MLMHKTSSSESLKERDHLGDVRKNWRIILKQFLKKQGVRLWTRSIQLRIGSLKVV
jgi:hypothetical protein